jgi:nifR3 family TIM-barrel protein
VRIGALEIEPPVVLAPMSGINDGSFRLLCRDAGAGLVYTGLISANALHYRSAKTDDMVRFSEGEHPVCAQVFGAHPEIVAKAAALAEAHGADVVDINMGCSVPKVLKGRAGAALMADAERAEAMVGAVVSAVRVPVGVKLRTGWRDRGEDAAALAGRCERAGAAVVAVHPRWVGQRFRGAADWSVIARVKEALDIPVIGSGDVRCAADAVRMQGETGCDGVMVGRAALGNPWIFGEVAAALRGEAGPGRPSVEERVAMAARHVELVVTDKGPTWGVLEMRKHIAWYLKGMPMARALRQRVNRATTGDELVAVLEEARAAAPGQATGCPR